MSKAFFSYSTDSAVTILGYELRSTDPTASDTGKSIFASLENANICASLETRLFSVFRFLPSSANWCTAWRKAKGENCIDLDLVYLTDAELPFWGARLLDLSPGLQRLVIGLAAMEVFDEATMGCATRLTEWGHDPAQIRVQFATWFADQGYTRIERLFNQFEVNANLSDCEGIVPWLNFDEIVLIYERFATNRSEFKNRLDSKYFFELSGKKPQNKKRAD